MSSGSYYEEEMSSGGHRRLTAFILWPCPLSKKSPLDPPSPWGWLGAYPHLDLSQTVWYVLPQTVIMGERQDAKDEIIGRRNCRTTIIQLNEKEKPEMGNLKKQSTQAQTGGQK